MKNNIDINYTINEYFDEDIITKSSTPTIHILPTKQDLNDSILDTEAINFKKWCHNYTNNIAVSFPAKINFQFRDLRCNEIYFPLVFLDKIALPIYLGIISSYIHDKFRGNLSNDANIVHLEATFKSKDGKLKKFSYKGDSKNIPLVIDKLNLDEFYE